MSQPGDRSCCGNTPCAGEDRPPEGAAAASPAPAWAQPAAAASTLDVRARVAAGDHPAAEIMARLQALAGEDVFQLVTPFVPGPLLARARDRGFAGHSVVEAEDLVRTFFRRAAP